jgi:hypothetical protein
MPKRVSTIDLAISIQGLGTVIWLPDQSEWSIAASEAIHRRERIQIRTLAGGCISTFVKDIPMISRRPPSGISLLLPPPILPDDLPERSELWLERDGTEPLIEPP